MLGTHYPVPYHYNIFCHLSDHPPRFVNNSTITNMKFILRITFVLGLVVASQAIGIRTEVFTSKTGSDQSGPNVEMVTRIEESGNGQFGSATVTNTVPVNSVFFGLGQQIADETFNGDTLPTSIKVRVFEDDNDPSKNDGVCVLTITAPFSTSPITVKCEREEIDGLAIFNIISVRVRRV